MEIRGRKPFGHIDTAPYRITDNGRNHLEVECPCGKLVYKVYAYARMGRRFRCLGCGEQYIYSIDVTPKTVFRLRRVDPRFW